MAGADPERQRLHRAIGALLGPRARALQPLAGGASNTSYLVACEDERYVLRLTRASPGATLALADELELLRALAAAGITPEAVGVHAGAGALLTRFLPDAAPWTAADARTPANIARIADLLRRLHAVPARAREFEPSRYTEDYLSAAAARAPLTAREQRLAASLRAAAAEYERRHVACVVCHGDLVAANVLDDGELRLVDFEYAALASPVLDLASLAAMNAYGGGERRELLRAYFGETAAPISAEEFATVVRMAALMAYFWARAGGHGADPQYLHTDTLEQ